MRNPFRREDDTREQARGRHAADPALQPATSGRSAYERDLVADGNGPPRHDDHDHDRHDRGDRPRPGKVHLNTAREAGYGRVSGLSIISGTMCAYGAFAIVAAIAGSLLSNTDLETDFRTNDWTSSGAAAGLVTALVLFAAYLFGGYVAGRMARRSGILHGVGVFVLSLVVGLLVGSMVSLADGVEVSENLRSIGVPTEWDQVESVGVAAAVASLVAMLLGSLVGGTLGERWHTKLANRFEDPAYGPAAEARAKAEREERAHRERREADPVFAGERSGTHSTAAAPMARHDETIDLRDEHDRQDRGHDQSDERDERQTVNQPVDATYQRTEHVSERRVDPASGRSEERHDETVDLRPPPPDQQPVAGEPAHHDASSGRRF